MTIELKAIPIETLKPSAFQPRRHFNEVSLKELAESIKSQGIIEPLIVRPTESQYFEIIAGERRWRAAQLAGLQDVPCLVAEYQDEQAMAISLIENIQREDLNPLDEARGYRKLLDEFSFHQNEVAMLTGKSRSHVANSVRLLSLDKSVQLLLSDGRLSSGHARLLVGLSAKLQYEIALKIISDNWSVRRTEKEIQKLKNPSVQKAVTYQKSRDVIAIETKLSEQVGAPVEILSDEQKKGGWIKIQYFDNDTLSGLIERLCPEEV